MFKVRLIALVFMLHAGHAMAADLSPVCAGFVGKWQVVEAATMADDKASWKEDLSDGNWHVDSLGSGKCRFFKANGAIDFDIDTSRGEYDVTDYTDGKPQPSESYKVVSFGAEGPLAWTLTTAVPHRPTSKYYSSMVLTVAGDLLMFEIVTADQPGGALVPRTIAVHRRLP